MPPFVSTPAGQFAFGRNLVDRIVSFLIDTAVLYYVSCCLLLVGAYSMMHSPWLPGSYFVNYCETYGIFLLYIVLLTGLCLLVFRRLSLFEDGLVMAGMALLLILDPTFFNNVFYTFSLRTGLLVNSSCFVLGIALYVALAQIGRFPWTWRSAALTAMVAGFVYYYPVGLNHGWSDTRTAHYFALLWWMPLLVATICETLPQMIARSNGKAIPEGMKRKFLIAGMMIPAYVVLSHLIEANYAYTLEFHAEFLTPVFLAVGLLIYKLTPIPKPVAQPAVAPPPVPAVSSNQPVRVDAQDLAASAATPPPNTAAGAASPAPPPMYGTPASYYVPRRQPVAPDVQVNANVETLVGLFAVLAALFTLDNSKSLTLQFGSLMLTPFRYGLIAVGLYLFHFWGVSRKPGWLGGTILGAFLIASGPSLPDAITNVSGFHPVPFYFLATVFAVCGWKRSATFSTLAGGCLLIAILSPLQFEPGYKVVFFVQILAAWTAAIHWYFYARQWVITLMGVFIFGLAAVLCVFGEHRLVWGIDYLAATVGIFCAGWFLQNSFLFMLSILGLAGAPVYFAQNHLSSILAGMRRNYGLLMTVLAFVTLPLAYFMSVLKRRRQR